MLDIVDRAAQWLLLREDKRKAQVREFLVMVEELCQELVDLEDGRSDRAKLLQQKARAFYNEASSVIGGKSPSYDLHCVVCALAAARMYCWIRYLDDSFESGFQGDVFPAQPANDDSFRARA